MMAKLEKVRKVAKNGKGMAVKTGKLVKMGKLVKIVPVEEEVRMHFFEVLVKFLNFFSGFLIIKSH